MQRRGRWSLIALLFAALAQPSGAQAAATRELTIRLSTGGIAAHAQVVALRGEDLATSARCDEQGRVQVAVGADRLFVAGATAVPCDVALAPDATEVVLPVARLAGQVSIDGSPPREPLTVGLVSRTNPSSIPRAALQSLGTLTFMTARAQTDDAGRFDFGLVPESLQCWLALPRDFGPPPGSRSHEAGLRVERPANDLVITAHALPHLTGRVLDAGGQPAAKVNVVADFRSARESLGNGAISGDDGRFSLVLSDEPWTSREVRFTAPAARRTLTLGAGSGSLDLGDVRLEAFEALAVEVRDPAGQPLAGAVVSTLDGKTGSAPSGPDGRVSFGEHVAADARLRASLLGYETCELDPSATPPLVAVLRPLSTLTIDIVLPDGRPAPMLRLDVMARHGLYAEEGYAARRGQQELGATEVQGCESANGGACIARAYLPQGHAVIAGLAPGASFDVAVADRCGHPLRAAETLSVARGEHASRRWVLDRSPRDVTVEVRGPDGDLLRAGLQTECMDAISQDAQGRVLITNVFADELSFHVFPPKDSGLGRTTELTRGVPENGVIVVQLVQARGFAIETVDANGTPVAARGYVHFGSTTLDLDPAADGRWSVGGFGEGEVKIDIVAGDLVGSLVQDTAEPIARVVVHPRTR